MEKEPSVLYRGFVIKQHNDGKWYVYENGEPVEGHDEFELAKGMIDHYFYIKRIRGIKK